MHDILLMPLNSSTIRCILSICSFYVLDALFDHLAQFSRLVFVSFRSVSSFINEPSDLIVSFIDLFILVFLRPRHISCFLCFFFGCLLHSCLHPNSAAVMFASSPRFVCCCCVCVLVRVVCFGFRNRSSRWLRHFSSGVCVLVPMVCCCDFSIDNSFCLLQHCQRLCHFRLLCESCSFGFMLDFSFEFNVALFKLVRFTRSRFFVVLALCALCCLLFFLATCVFFVRLPSLVL